MNNRRLQVTFGVAWLLLAGSCGCEAIDNSAADVVSESSPAPESDSEAESDSAPTPDDDAQSNNTDTEPALADEPEPPPETEPEVVDEQTSIDIIAGAASNGIDDDLASGSPPGFPTFQCGQDDDGFAVSGPETAAPTRWDWGRVVRICLPTDDLWFVEITDPDGDIRAAGYRENGMAIDLSVLDKPGDYTVDARSRRGAVKSGSFVFEQPDHLVIEPVATDLGWAVAIAGYGDEPDVHLVAYGDTGEVLPVFTKLEFLADLGSIPLRSEHVTVLDVTGEVDNVCLFRSAAEADRFPNADRGCLSLGLPTSSAPAPFGLDKAVTDAVGDESLVAGGAQAIRINDATSIAIATLYERDTLDSFGAVAMVGSTVSGEAVPLDSMQVLFWPEERDFVASYRLVCDMVREQNSLSADPCAAERTQPIPISELDAPVVLIDPPVAQVIVEDCLNYDPATVDVVAHDELGWLLVDGAHSLSVLDTKQDALDALAVAQHHRLHCFVGRSNKRPNRLQYIADFWVGGDSGGPDTVGSICLTFDNQGLELVDQGKLGWELSDGNRVLLTLDTRDDAVQARSLAENFTRQCFIGSSNERSNRDAYIFDYWK